MKKYLSVFAISFQQEFVYRANFIMWRVRNVIQILVAYFLWDTIFSDPGRVVFGYDRARIVTYILGLIFVRSLVLSARSVDVAGEMARGDLANYLLKPVSYVKYWLTRDFSSKALNLLFGLFELGVLFLLLRPGFYLQTDFYYLALSAMALVLAVLLYFLLLFLFNLFTLWYPEQPWGPAFLLMIFVEFLGGGIFPLDVLPTGVQTVLYLTPFPYLLFSPLQIYLGKFSQVLVLQRSLVALAWVVLLAFLVGRIWKLGLRTYDFGGK